MQNRQIHQTHHFSQNQLDKAKKIKLFVMDVDGVLTDGKIIYDSHGVESKEFHVQDGLGLALLKKMGITLAIITGRNSPMVQKRAEELGIDHLIQGRHDKYVALNELVQKLGLDLSECAYMGDDLPDLKAILYAGLGVSVPNGAICTQEIADFVTQKQGGFGAVREVCELLIIAGEQWDKILQSYQ